MSPKTNDATASMFGWQFQVAAAIIMMLEDMKSNIVIKVEGKKEDIEIQKNDGSVVLAQAKAMQESFAPSSAEKVNQYNSNARKHLKKALNKLYRVYKNQQSLSNTTVDNFQLVYVSNIQYPFGTKSSKSWGDGGIYKFNELSEVEIELLPDDFPKEEEKFSNALTLRVIRYENVENWETQQTKVLDVIKDFLRELDIDTSYAKNYLKTLHNLCSFNASSSKWTLGKERFIWAALVEKMRFSSKYFEEEVEECTLDENDICTKYRDVIDEMSYRMPMCMKILAEYGKFKCDGAKELEKRKRFAKEYGKVLASEDLSGLQEDARSVVAEYIVWNTIKARNVFNNAHNKFLI